MASDNDIVSCNCENADLLTGIHTIPNMLKKLGFLIMHIYRLFAFAMLPALLLVSSLFGVVTTTDHTRMPSLKFVTRPICNAMWRLATKQMAIGPQKAGGSLMWANVNPS